MLVSNVHACVIRRCLMMYVAYCKAIGVTVGGGAAHDDGVKVVVYRKLCKIETLLLQATNRK